MPDVNGATLTGTHDASLVVLSIAIAIAASYTALDLAERVRATEGMARRLWLATAALAMGGGAWAMHFVAMLALSLPRPVAYAPGLALLSLAIPVLFSGLGFAVMWRRGGRRSDLLPGGLLIGAGIAAMHYTGMAAMPAELHYNVPLVALSVLIAIGAATVALWLAQRDPTPPERAAAAVAMGLAIVGMHYTAVAAASWVPLDGAAMEGTPGQGAVRQAALALGVAAVTFLVLFIALITALMDRHLATRAERRAAAVLRESEARLRIAGEAGDIGIWDRDLVTDSSTYSGTLNRLHGLPPDAPGPRYEEWLARIHPEDRTRADAAIRAGLASGSYEDEYQILRPDGEVRWIAARGVSLRDTQGRPVRFVGVSTDVTERRQAEAALREHSRRLEILSEAAAGLLAARTPDEVLEPLFRSLSKEFGLDLSFSFAVVEGTGGLRLVSCIGVPEEARAGLDRLAREDVVCGTVAKTRKPMHVAEVQASDDPKLEAIRSLAVHAYVCFPLLTAGGRLLGTLSFGTRRRDRFSEEEIAFLDTIARYVAVVREREHAEAALRETEARQRDLLLTLDLGASMVRDLDGTIRFWSAGCAHLYGWSATDAVGQDAHSMLHTIFPVPQAEIEAVLERKGEWVGDLRQRTRDGRELVVTAHKALRRGPDGRPVAVLESLTDVTAQRRAEAALAESEARLRAAVEGSPFPIMLHAEDGEVLALSRSWMALSGYAPEEIPTHFDWLRLAYPDRHEEILAQLQREFAAGNVMHAGEINIRTKTGAERIWDFQAVPLGRLPDGRRLQMSAAVDVTERKRAEADLRRQFQLTEAITNNAAVALFIADERQHCVFMNPAAEKLTGFTLAEIAGRPLHDVVHHTRPDGSRYPIEECPINRAFPGNNQEQGEDVFVHKDGHFYEVAFTASPIREDGRPVGTVIEVQDITERKRTEAALARHQAELERLVEERTAALLRAAEERRRAEEAARQSEKLAALGQLTGGVAHDFNNLLQVVSSGASLLKRASVPEAKKAEILEGMIQAGRTARDLTGRLLAFARQQTLRPEVIDVGTRLATMSELLRQTLGSRIRVETDLEPGLWPVRVDPSQLEVAILNLAVNARDAMPEGGKITIQACNARLEASLDRAAGEYVCIAVKDSGKGMPRHILTRVLEPFFTTKKAGLGTGLGLPQVHGFVRQSGGDMQIESEPGQGTVVSLHLPRAAADDDRRRQPEERKTDALQGVGKTVLVVEDNPDVAAFACSLLEELGYATRHAGSATEALTLLADGERVDAVFSDVVMPGGISGAELAAVLRFSYPRMPVVLATGYSEQLARSGTPEGIEVLGKPYHPEELAAALERALARSRGMGEAAE